MRVRRRDRVFIRRLAYEEHFKPFCDRRARRSCGKFFNESDCDCAELLRVTAFSTLRKLGWTPRERAYFVVDDTQIEKRGKKTEGVCRTFSLSEKSHADAHTVATGRIGYKGVAVHVVSVSTEPDLAQKLFREVMAYSSRYFGCSFAAAFSRNPTSNSRSSGKKRPR